MAEKNIAVNLTARVAQYVAAMGKARAATAELSASGATGMARLGGQMQILGRAATLGVTVPLVALGTGAVAMAAKFDTAFAQMVGLANVPASEVDGLKESVLALAGETAQAPQDLAEALYFAASAGLDSAQAMDAVELAAKGAAAGMGSAQDIVGLVASATASYGAANISAAEATDILTATIREGRAEPAELAATLGRVLPIASQMGITFAEVGGATAYLTNIMGGADISTTALRDALMKLSAPGTAAKTALLDMGTSFEELQASISEDGLLGALELLREHGFAGNAEALHALMPDAQGYLALTALLNDESGQLAGTIDAVTNSTGSLDFAFGAVSETSGFKMKQAMTDLKVAMIQVGDILLPFAASAASAISGLVSSFSELNPAVQTTIVAFAGLMAAAGPLTSIAGTMLKNWTSIAGAFGVSEGAATKAGKAFGALGLVVGTAIAIWKILDQGHLNASAHIDTTSDALANETQKIYDAAVAADAATTSVDALAIAHEALSNAIFDAAGDELRDAFAGINISGDEVLDTFIALQTSGDVLVASTEMLGRALGSTGSQMAAYTALVRGGERDHEVLAASLGVSVDQFDAVAGALDTVTNYALENSGEIDTMVLSYLQAQVALGGTSRAAVLAAEGIAGSRFEAGNAIPVYEETIRQLTLLDPAAAQAALGVEGLGSAAGGAVPPIEEVTGALDEMRAASEVDTSSNLQDYLSDLTHIWDEYSNGLKEALGGTQALVRAHDSFQSALIGFNDTIEESSAGLDYNTEAGLANREGVFDLADELIGLTQANIDAGMATEDVNAEYQAGRVALLDAAEAAGLNRGEVDQLITAYGLVPELVTTAIQIANDALMKWRIERYLEKLDEIPEEQATAIEAAIDAGDWAEANRLLGLLVAPRDVAIHPYLTQSSFHVSVTGGTGGGRMVGILASASGRYVDHPMLSTLGEHGNEAVLPLSNAGRMRELIADPRIGEPIMAALSGISEVGPRGSAALGNITPTPNGTNGGGNTSVINVAVNMPPGSDGDDVVRALKQWQRRSGPLPLAVR